MTHIHDKHDRSAGYTGRVLPAGLARPAGYIAKTVAAASVTGLIAMAAPATKAEAGTPKILPRARNANPLIMPVNAGEYSKPALVDIDGDGDLDMFVGGEQGYIHYFENTGTDTAPNFRLRVQADNPFWYSDSDGTYVPYQVNGYAAPAFADLDGDGDLDAVGGEFNGAINYFENTGTASAPEFTERTGSDAPAPFWYDGGGTYYQRDFVSDHPAPTFADIDGDGDQDLFVGDRYSGDTIYFYENNGTATSPDFSTSAEADPFGLYSTDSYNTPTFVDIDADGDLDAFIGGESGNVAFFKNVGNSVEPDFELQSSGGGVIKAVVPLATMNVGAYSAPAFADIDGDGDMDAFIGGSGSNHSGDSQVFFYENTGNAQNPAFTRIAEAESPTWGVDVGRGSQPAFVDVDNDGDPDAFIGAADGTITFFENTGSAGNPDFGPAEANDVDNPFNGVDVGQYASPAFVDVDDDGDQDAFIGQNDGYLLFYENVGTASAPDFVANAGDNPFAGVDVDSDSAPVFADIDGDGDMDAFVGAKDGYINYFENTSTASAITFSSGATNPMAGVDVGTDSIPAAADFDGDGDIDLMIGNNNGEIYYYENTGTTSAPAFTQNTDYENQDMGFLQLIGETAPAFADIDGDGDMDLFAGEAYGRVVLLENRDIVAQSTGGSTPAWVYSDNGSSTCFIDSTIGQTGPATEDGHSWSPGQAVKKVYARLISLFQ